MVSFKIQHAEPIAVRTDSSRVNKPYLSNWSNRILVASVAGILFFTLYPFRVDLSRKPAGNGNPFLLGASQTEKGYLGSALNVLLFVPFGFGLSGKLRERGMSQRATLFAVLAAGAIVSYDIEFAQIYVPPRDSGWLDVFTNSAGSVVGFLLFETLGLSALRLLSKGEDLLRQRRE